MNPHVVSLRTPTPEPEPTPPPMPFPPRKPERRRRSPAPIASIIVCVLLIVAGFFGYRWYTSDEGKTPSASEQTSTAPESDDLIKRVGELIVLPEGEEPTIATVTDPEKLKEQAFFARAKTGDKVLIYTQARKAYLYDPAAHKLLEVAPLTTDITQ